MKTSQVDQQMFTSKTKQLFKQTLSKFTRFVVVLWEKLNICKWYRRKTKAWGSHEGWDGKGAGARWNYELHTSGTNHKRTLNSHLNFLGDEKLLFAGVCCKLWCENWGKCFSFLCFVPSPSICARELLHNLWQSLVFIVGPPSLSHSKRKINCRLCRAKVIEFSLLLSQFSFFVFLPSQFCLKNSLACK